TILGHNDHARRHGRHNPNRAVDDGTASGTTKHAFLKNQKGRCAMPYCITLRSDERITGWYDGSNSRWSTDHRRQKLFDKKRDAKPVRHELRKLCPRIADVINIE